MRAILVGAAIAATLALAACGGDSDSLNADQQYTVAKFRADVATTVLDSSGYESLLDSMDEVIALAREEPGAVYEDSAGQKLTMTQVLSDAASDLQPYRPEMAAELDRAVQTLQD